VSATGLQSLGLADCPYVTDDVLRRIGEMRQLRNLRLDLSDCDKTTAAGVTDMLSGCERLREPPGPSADVPADVRAVIVSRPPGRPADRRRLATIAGRWFPRRRRVQRPADVHQDHRDGRLTGRAHQTTTVTVTASPCRFAHARHLYHIRAVIGTHVTRQVQRRTPIPVQPENGYHNKYHRVPDWITRGRHLWRGGKVYSNFSIFL